MKVLFISDIHGSDEWHRILTNNFHVAEKVVFLGDYVDSFDGMPDLQKDNLNELINYKKKYPEKVTLLLGNHDYAYVFGFSGISGYNSYYEHDFREIFNKNWELFDIAIGFGEHRDYTLATHAGLTNSFLDKLVWKTHEYLDWSDFPHKNLNLLKDKKDLLWDVGRARGGLSSTPSVLWADASEVRANPYANINQVFGHTPLPSNYMRMHGNNFLLCIDNRYSVQSIIIDL